MIDIIIPAYNAHKTIEQTLCSIAYQNISDKFNVYIVNDSSNKDYSKIVKFFEKFIKIKELKLKKNSGPGLARQFGIDNSNGDYIIFMDSDDCFSDCFSASFLYNAIKDGDYDVVISSIVEETDYGFFLHNNSKVWLHGKIYKRKYLIDNDIHFNNSRYDEDNAFNQLIFLGNPKEKVIDTKTYIRRNNPTSLTKKYDSKDLKDYIYNITWVLSEAIDRGYDKHKIAELSYSAMLYIFYSYLNCYWLPISKRIIINSKKLKEIMMQYELTEEEKIESMKVQFDIAMRTTNPKYLLNQFTSFDNFLKMIDEVGEEYD